MGNQVFEVVLFGNKEGIPKNEIITNISKLFKAKEEKIANLINRKPVVVKKALDYQVALKYKTALEKAGAMIRIDSPTGNGSVGGISGSMVCPKCGHEQTVGVECIKCGIVVSKYKKINEDIAPSTNESAKPGQDGKSRYLNVPFIPLSLTSFLYPLKGDNYLTVLAGVLFFWVLGFIPIIGGLASIIFLFMMKAYMLVIIEASAGGGDALPEYPELEELIRPFFLVLLTQILCFLPVSLYLISFSEAHIYPLLMVNPGSLVTGAEAFQLILTDPVFWLLLILGIVCMPMGLLNVALYNNILRVNPVTLVSSIAKIPGDYFAACLLISLVYVLAFLLKFVLFAKIPILGGLLLYSATVYFMIVQMRIIGLLYATNSSRLGWID